MKYVVTVLAVAGLAASALAEPNKTFTFNGNVAIPDNVVTPTPIQITVPADPDGENTITDLNVGFITRHTFQGDIRVSLRHPDGTMISLMDRPGQPQSLFGFSNDNFGNPVTDVPFVWDDDAPFAYDTGSTGAPVTNPVGNWVPDGADRLSAFDGKSKVGTWTLFVSDVAAGDTGVVESWSLNFTQIPTPGAAAVMALAGAAVIRRRRSA